MASVDPRTAIHTTDLDGDDFAIKEGKIVSKQGFAGPFEITEGTIADYENQSGKPELVWLGGTEANPSCAWVVYPGGTAIKIKWPTPNEEGFCAQVIECLSADLELGSGTPDKYRIPEMNGPTWRVVSVEWIDEEGDAQSDSFSADIGTDLASLVAALNDGDNLPEDWYWEILTSALCLVVPHGTNIVKVILEAGEEAVFNGTPTVVGTPSSTLGDSITVNPIVYGNGATIASANDTEAEIEAQFALNQTVQVRWTDADGDPRISYKDPINGWYHPVKKEVNPTEVFLYMPSDGSAISTTVINETILLTADGVPSNAKYARIKFSVVMYNISASTGTTKVTEGGVEGLKTGNVHSFSTIRTHADLALGIQAQVENFNIRLRSGAQFEITFTADKAINHRLIVMAELLGWER